METQTAKILKKHIGSDYVQTIDSENGIFKCHKDFNGNPYQILYVDCSNKWLQPNFDKELESYQESILLKDYYEKSGPIQWNFYYAFISSSTDIQNHKKEKERIEKDELYTRKLVLSNDELEQWLSRIENLSKQSTTLIEKDLSALWINKLKAAELDAVFLGEKYTSGVDRYLDNDPILAPQEIETNEGNYNKDVITTIDYLKIENYRNHPVQKEFDFAQVNLIKGLNGSGKTSLLEAIELMLCGKTDRNEKFDTSNIKLKARFSKKQEIVNFALPTHKIYKERDKAWYNNANQRTNRLHRSFNKFNFYNTDAATTLSFDSGKSDVKGAFQDIALGSEVNDIEDKLQGFYDRFLSVRKGYDKLVLEHNNTLKAQEQLVLGLKKIDQSPATFIEQLYKEAKAIKWQIKEKEWSDKIVAEQERRISNSLSLISSIQKILSWYNIIGYNSITKGLKEHTDCLKDINEVDSSIKKESSSLEKFNSELEGKSDLSIDLENLKEYFDEPKLNQLKGLTNRIQDQKELINLIKKIKQLSADIDFPIMSVNSGNTKLNTFENQIRSGLEKKGTDLKKLNDRKNKLDEGFSQLEKLISEIKSKGKEYIKLNATANECPLCYTILPKGKLVESIQSSKKNFQSSGIYDELLDQISKLKKEVKIDEKTLNTIDRIKKIATLLSSEKTPIKTIAGIEKEIKDVIATLTKETEFYDQLIDIQDIFKEKGLTERKFDSFMEELNSWDIEIKDKKSFDRLYNEIKADILILKKKIVTLTKLIKSLENKRKDSFSILNIIDKSPKVTLEKRINDLTEAKKYFLELDNYIEVKNNEKLSTYETDITKLKTLLARYKKISIEKEEHDSRIQAATKTIKHAKDELALIKPKHARAKKAITAIKDILQKDSKEKFLEEFINKNKEEISEIFKVIHSPKEFKELVFDSEGTIQLQRTNQTGLASLTEISTGQRSALALSIFSALNRKLKNGPNILLFDDPVANIDDLNILSYFDYLREVVVNGNRQIFFATASENIAFLFAQKFKVLGENLFKEFEFSR